MLYVGTGFVASYRLEELDCLIEMEFKTTAFLTSVVPRAPSEAFKERRTSSARPCKVPEMLAIFENEALF